MSSQQGRYWSVFALIALLAASTGGRADPPALPPGEQQLVNRAIDGGLRFLKATQGPQGNWASSQNKCNVGYTSLCGLCLLECGEPRLDASVQRAAQYVRQTAMSQEETYEIALAILLLDRIGAESDRLLIQNLAAKLMAGQTVTGGWGYKCPNVPATTRESMMATLRALERRPHIPAHLLIEIGRPGLELARSPSQPGQGGFEGAGGFRKMTIPGIERPWAFDRAPASSYGSGGSASSSSAASSDGGLFAGGPLGFPRRGACIKASDLPSSEPSEKKETRTPAEPLPPAFVPQNLQGLAVNQDPKKIVLKDHEGRARQPIAPTTDNSNTQFALLALWAARRHDVPVRRSLNLLAVRFATSQNADGSWSYAYAFGGDNKGTAPMSAVGLLGLAVGHNLAHDGQRHDRVVLEKDPMLVQGLTALGRSVGIPTGALDKMVRGQPVQVTQPNLYFLWSVERVGMLYNLTEIGGKKWYPWGAEALVANQQPQGHWANGGYPGADPVLDTCLALLFLKRVNLARDVAKELPFKQDEPKKEETVAKVDPAKPTEPSKPPEPPPMPTKKEDISSPPQQPRENVPPLTPPTQASETEQPTPKGPSRSEEDEGSGTNATLGIIFAIVALLLLAGSLFFFLNKKQGAKAEASEKPRPKKPKVKARPDAAKQA